MAKERPILFSGPMVRAILENRKTLTRRVVMAINHDSFEEFTAADPSGFWGWDRENNPVLCVHCPYGEVGDRLWVRESFCKQGVSNDIELAKRLVVYRSTHDDPESYKWHPSIHMPRWASRITLEITGVRVERLNEISMEDCCAEGIKADLMFQWLTIQPFQKLWESINGAGSWAANPWVWVVEFKTVENERV